MPLKAAFAFAAVLAVSAAGSAYAKTDIDRMQAIATDAACGHKDQTLQTLKSGVDRDTLWMMHLWTAKNIIRKEGVIGNAKALHSDECQLDEARRDEMLGLIENASSSEQRQDLLDGTLEQIAMDDRVETARYLLEQGANPNAPSIVVKEHFNTNDARTLRWAAENRAGKEAEMVRLLLQHGADPALALQYLDDENGESDQKARTLIIKTAKDLRIAVQAP